MEDSIFTKIIKGEISAHKIYEDSKIIAFLDVHPLTDGHTLVVPKVQIDHIWDLDVDTYKHLFDMVRYLGGHIKTVMETERVGVVVEGFGVPHAHVHLIPIESADDLKQRQNLSGEINHVALERVASRLQLSL